MKKKTMIKLRRIALNASIVATLIIGLTACDNELNTIGSDILGADQLIDRIQKQEFDVIAFNELIGPVQTNNFTSMPLGSYTDPVYGRTDYGFVTQLSLPTSSPDFGVNPVLESVVLNIPYFSTITEVDSEDTIYEIDSLYGIDPIHLQIFQSNYFLNDFDPLNVDQPAVYFSDLETTIDAQKGPMIYEKIDFIPSADEIILTEIDEEGVEQEIERLSPRLRVPLDNSFWETLIIDQEGTSNLQSNNNFQNFFRGLYFKVNNVVINGNLVHLNLDEAFIDLNLKINIEDVTDVDDDGDTTDLIEIDTQFTLEFNGNRVGFINSSQLNPSVISDIEAANDDVNGEERLYLKGGSGSVVLIDLFGPDLDMNGEADALTQVIANDWIINEASLTFYVDQASVTAGESEPERITIYNSEDNTILADFSLTSSSASIDANTNHLGRLERVDDEDESSEGVKYRIRLTQHINSIIEGDIENVRLALAVTQNVNFISNSEVKNPGSVENISIGSAISHEGTILHGNLSSDPEKRLKLEIYYTETN